MMATEAYLKTRAGYSSRYRMTHVVVDGFVHPGRRRYGIWRKPTIDMTGYSRHVVRENDIGRIDLIANRLYGDSSLWWAICMVNAISNPLEDLVVGMILKVPRKEKISNAFANTTVQ